MTFRSTSSALPKVTLMVALAALGVTLTVPRTANAFAIPPCEMTECPSAGPGAWSAVTSAVIGALAALETDMYADFIYFKDAVTRLANQSSNDSQNEMKSLASIGDRNAANQLQMATAFARAEAVPQLLPSRSVCNVESRNTQVQDVSFSSSAAVRASETVTTGILSNAAGTPGTLGQLGYSAARFQNRTTKYCNTATVVPPGGMTCTATIGVDRDLKPYDSIFKQETLAAANDYTAAKDVILNIMGDAVRDPVRGPVLIRQEGQNLSVQRYSEQAKLNLASSVLLSMVERRRDLTSKGSEQSMMQSASYVGMANTRLREAAEMSAGETSGQNLDKIGAMIGDGSRGIFVLRQFLEQWAALKAVSLAIDIQQNGAGTSGIAGRPVNN